MSRQHIRGYTHHFLKREGIASYHEVPDHLKTWNEYLYPPPDEPAGNDRMNACAKPCGQPAEKRESDWVLATLVDYDVARHIGWLRVEGCQRDIYFTEGMLRERKLKISDVHEGIEIRWKLRDRGPALANARRRQS